jgi:hypothetical protein
VFFAAAGALRDLYDATIVYNVRYSGETYPGIAAFVRYLATFPVQMARLDALWFLAGLSSFALLAASWRRPALLVAPAWIAAACLAIAINGSRGLPQYFVQVGPALALTAGIGGAAAWHAMRPVGRVVLIAALAVACARVTNFEKVFESALFDTRYVLGHMSTEEFLLKFGVPRRGEKFSAHGARTLGEHLAAHTARTDSVYIFGYAAGAYVYSQRRSGSRFFWSEPVINRFNDGVPGYGPRGVVDDLTDSRPLLIVLQRDDGMQAREDSASFFLSDPDLGSLLRNAYEPSGRVLQYEVWRRRQ